MKPQTRRSGLLIRELPDELLVYDQEQHRAHCLNRTAALVFRHADGTRTAADLARLPGADDEVVRLALDQLTGAGLLEVQASDADAELSAGMSRREVARRVGIAAAILLPAVASIVAPTPAEAAATCVASCAGKTPGTPCTSFFANPCTETCASSIAGSCSDGGGA
jgi:hypothetical protein